MANVLTLKDAMAPSFLIQGLEKASGKAIFVTSPFGPGLCLSDRDREAVKDLFSFQFMGASEFEWGVVPSALYFLDGQSALGQLVAGEHRSVYYIAPTRYEAGVIQLIDRLLDDEPSVGLLEPCGLAETLANVISAEQTVIGWLEVDNGFLFFVDQTMFGNCKRFFHID